MIAADATCCVPPMFPDCSTLRVVFVVLVLMEMKTM
jgi:hypothetical protein